MAFTVFGGYCALKEHLSKWDLAGASLVFTGVVVCAVFGPHTSARYTVTDLKEFWTDPDFAVFISVVGVVMAGCVIAVHPRVLRLLSTSSSSGSCGCCCCCCSSSASRRGRRGGSGTSSSSTSSSLSTLSSTSAPSPILLPLLFSFLSGSFGAVTNILLKAVSSIVETSVAFHVEGEPSLWVSWEPYVFIGATVASALLQIIFLNRGLSLFDAVNFIPLYTAFMIVVSTVAGGLYYHEFEQMEAVSLVMFGVGTTIVLAGVLVGVLRTSQKVARGGDPSSSSSSSFSSSRGTGGAAGGGGNWLRIDGAGDEEGSLEGMEGARESDADVAMREEERLFASRMQQVGGADPLMRHYSTTDFELNCGTCGMVVLPFVLSAVVLLFAVLGPIFVPVTFLALATLYLVWLVISAAPLLVALVTATRRLVASNGTAIPFDENTFHSQSSSISSASSSSPNSGGGSDGGGAEAVKVEAKSSFDGALTVSASSSSSSPPQGGGGKGIAEALPPYFAFVIANFNHDTHLLRRVLVHLASHGAARQRYIVVLAMEAQEVGSGEKANELEAEFHDAFMNISHSSHLGGIEGECEGKASNVTAAGRHLCFQVVPQLLDPLEGGRSVRLEEVVVTCMHADSIVTEDYIHQLQASLCQSPGPRGGLLWHRTMFMPYMAFHSLSSASADTSAPTAPPTAIIPGCTRLFDLCWAASMLCSLEQGEGGAVGEGGGVGRGGGRARQCTPVKFPASTYSLSLLTLREMNFWETSHIGVGVDHHTALQLYFTFENQARYVNWLF